MKLTYLAAFAATAALVVASCTDANVSKLKTDVALAQHDTPLEAGLMGQITSVTYDEGDNNVHFTFQPTEGSFDSISASECHSSCTKMLRVYLNRGQQAEVLRQAALAKASVSAGYNPTDAMFTLSSDTVRYFVDNPFTGPHAVHAQLALHAGLFCTQCPFEMVPDINTNVVLLTDSTMIWWAITNPMLLGRVKADVPSARHFIWNNMKERAKTPVGRTMYKNLFDSKMDAVYKITASGDSVILPFTYKELYFLIR